jgi:hypothetical protein
LTNRTIRRFCGPLEIEASSDAPELHEKLHKELSLLDFGWPKASVRVQISLCAGPPPAFRCTGNYLEASRMKVDFDGEQWLASCDSGAWCQSVVGSSRWRVVAPLSGSGLDEWTQTDIERILSLILTTEWRQLFWVPIHAGAVSDGKSCAVLCAESGGGKSSLTAAFLHRGWQTLGDDKLLLQIEDGRPVTHALARTFNLHPDSAGWFPEVTECIGDIRRFPQYSSWTEKRKVPIEKIWPGQTRASATPTHLIRVTRTDRPGVSLKDMDSGLVLATLLRQTVIPNDAGTARWILSTVAGTASTLKGLELSVGPDAYQEADVLDEVILTLQAK